MNQNLIDFYRRKINDPSISKSEREIYKNKIDELTGQTVNKKGFSSILQRISRSTKKGNGSENPFYDAAFVSGGDIHDFLIDAGIQYEMFKDDESLSEYDRIYNSLVNADLMRSNQP